MKIADELKGSDTIVSSAGLFTVPATLKAWADLVARAGRTFRYTQNGPEGLLTGKTVYIMATGGMAIDSDIVHVAWLKFFLGFLGMTDVQIAADGIMGEGGEEKIVAAHQEVERLAA